MAVDLVRIAAARPDHVAFGIAGGPRRSFGALDDRSRRLAATLHGEGLRPGDVVAVVLENVLEWPTSSGPACAAACSSRR